MVPFNVRHEKITLRNYRTEDCSKLAALLHDTVHTVNAADYTETQLNAWANGKVDLGAWNLSFRSNKTIVAEINDTIVGFGSLDIGFECSMCARGKIHLLYVHKNCQRMGVGKTILKALEAHAQSLSVSELSVYSSITAKPFFQAMGYTVVRDNTVERDGVVLKNYLMRKAVDLYE